MPKKLPMRQCVGCRSMRPKRELLRVVRGPEGGVTLDFKGKAPGRGAYVCPDAACLKKAQKTRALERAFEAAVPAEVFEALAGQLAAAARTPVEAKEAPPAKRDGASAP